LGKVRGDPLATDQSQFTSHRYLAFYHLAPRTLPPPLKVMSKNRPGPARAYKLCHMWLKRLTITAALSVITQLTQTYASHVDNSDSFTVLCVYVDQKTSKGKSVIYDHCTDTVRKIID